MCLEALHYRITKKNAPAYSLSGRGSKGEYKNGGAYVCSTWNMMKMFFHMMRDKDIKEITIKKY